ncbi:tyrosinase [Diplocarpon rosae]|nr:tyrosinase [Diplocarpon rosae]
MLFFSVVLGLAAIVSASPLSPRNTTRYTNTTTSVTNTTLNGHYLPANITSRTFFNGSCTAERLSIRKEWRSLTQVEKMAFVDAELCAMSLPNKTSLPGSTTRFEDFQAAHQRGTMNLYGDIVHYTAQFLPWHRFHLHAHESVLRNECNYTGTIPFWDEAIDAASGNFFQSDMWSDQYFGGNGSPVDGCVRTGAFANRTMHIGPFTQTTDYCFNRNFNYTSGLTLGARANTDACYKHSATDFETFYKCMASSPHVAGHRATGGVMVDVNSSPGDPLFYLHHCFLDRLYWQWQQISGADRIFAISGNTTVTEPPTGWEKLTLDYELDMSGAYENVRLEEVMNIQGGYLCYAYEY